MKYTHLTEDDRYQIDELLREGQSKTCIAQRIGRERSTLYRELKRNVGQRGWRPRQANQKAINRLSYRGVQNVRRVCDRAWHYAQEKLVNEQWSPEQIAGRLKEEAHRTLSISHETIYQRILEDKQTGGTLCAHLRCQKKRRKRYGSGTFRRSRIPNRVGIENRPKSVDTREETGDWEGDTIIGSHTGGAVIASMVERKSRFTVLVKSPNKTTASVIGGIADAMQPWSEIVRTITFDNGNEFCAHEQLSSALDARVFFATPYHSWERGLNENTNGLVRQYFPKRTSFDKISKQDLQQVVTKLNTRPRKCLGYRTPIEMLRILTAKRRVALRI